MILLGSDKGRGSNGSTSRLHLDIRGAVQGVGFRPFVYRLAAGMGLTGWVCNTFEGVQLEVEGEGESLLRFQDRLRSEKPPLATIISLESNFLDPLGFERFVIRESEEGVESPSVVAPDVGTCLECLAEINDPASRRFQYPFTNCTDCGPRYTIIEDLPYDRHLTTMKSFQMCQECRAEYDDPADRRFHAQPIACPKCGPQLSLHNRDGKREAVREQALKLAVAAIRAGQIVAVKGIGGYHLMVDACNEEAVAELRRRKHRTEKPLAILYPDLVEAGQDCQISTLEEQLLQSPAAPIVLLERRSGHQLGRPSPEAIAPGVSTFGVMLPCSPLHHLLLQAVGGPVVATSGNVADEPICIDDDEAFSRLSGLADLFLTHNRAIRRHVDDSIVRVIAGRMMILRRARGFAPLPIWVGGQTEPILATGAHYKNCIALANGEWVFLSQHIGDLESAETINAHERLIGEFATFHRKEPVMVAHDTHPDYHLSRHPLTLNLPRFPVQHHYAHALACLADNRLSPPVLAVTWDGTGYGDDGTIWGGEFLRIHEAGFKRLAHWRTFALPGGESAIREPRRAAMGLLHELFGSDLFTRTELAPVQQFGQSAGGILESMLARRINSPRTSSVGRLFDAIASLIGLRHLSAYEGQAAIELEHALSGQLTADCYPVRVTVGGESTVGLGNQESSSSRTIVLDWEPMVWEIISDLANGAPIPFLSAKFHNTLVESLVTIAVVAGEERVCLTGGCFQNRYLTERTVLRLRREGIEVYWHQQVPSNDGGIALGQALAAAHFRRHI